MIRNHKGWKFLVGKRVAFIRETGGSFYKDGTSHIIGQRTTFDITQYHMMIPYIVIPHMYDFHGTSNKLNSRFYVGVNSIILDKVDDRS